LAALAMVAAACGGSSGGGGTSSKPTIGVVLTYNLPGFWGNYLKYETQYESQLGVTLVGPKVANVEANGNEVAQQILDIRSLISPTRPTARRSVPASITRRARTSPWSPSTSHRARAASS
jgi:ABC-type sugar transport system substrate-binding protein